MILDFVVSRYYSRILGSFILKLSFIFIVFDFLEFLNRT